MSSFILLSDFSTISKTLGEMWSGLPDKEKLVSVLEYMSSIIVKLSYNLHTIKAQISCRLYMYTFNLLEL